MSDPKTKPNDDKQNKATVFDQNTPKPQEQEPSPCCGGCGGH